MVFLEVKGLQFYYEQQLILDNLNFKIQKGELIAIVGPSGCGKTTLLKIIAGILQLNIGKIFLDNEDITNQSIENRNIGYVPQDQALFPHLSIYDNIAFGLKAQKWKKNKIINRVSELANLGGIKELLQRKPHELSGGQKQRVALLRALAPIPNLLLLDEPLSNLDSRLREKLAIYIRNIQKIASITTLFVTHDQNEAIMLADRLIVLNEGRILQFGDPIDVSTKPDSLETALTLGLKNIFKIYSVSTDEKQNTISFSTEIGKLKFQSDDALNKKKTATGIIIDPAKIQLNLNPPKLSKNLIGRIISIIPDKNTEKSLVILKMEDQSRVSTETNILHVQLPITNNSFQIFDDVQIQIPIEAISFY